MTPVRTLSAAVAVLVLAAAAAPAQEYPKPGPEHALLKQLEGNWDAKIKFSPQPGAPAQESTGEYTAKMEIGGYFLVTEHKGTMLGQPFQARGLIGYDPVKKKYTGTWVDSMGPFITPTEGSFDKAGKVFTDTMDMAGPDGKLAGKMKAVTEIKDKDTLTFKLFMPAEGGKEVQIMDTVYTRKK